MRRTVPAPVITASLYARFSSRQPDSMAARIIAALRNQFGGHQFLTESAAAEVAQGGGRRRRRARAGPEAAATGD